MKKGDIFLVNFDPAFGSEYQKVRPAVIIQSQKISSQLITVMPISSKLKNKNQNDISIRKNQNNRLFLDSLIKVAQVSSFDKGRLFHFIGKADSLILKKIDVYLKKHFSL